jgi:hypothetical protein
LVLIQKNFQDYFNIIGINLEIALYSEI